jgi:tetratricopeptide (TPR) repeat protein
MLRYFVLYRLYAGVALILLGVYVAISAGFWASFLLFLVGIIFILAHFLIGSMRLAQTSMEAGDLDAAKADLNLIKYPKFLIKPLRSAYYMIQSNIALADNDMDAAKKYSQQSLDVKSTLVKDYEGQSYFQLGMIAMQKGNLKEANENLKIALQKGLPDVETKAAAYLQLSGICLQRRDFRGAKINFKLAKELKPKQPQIVEQLKMMEKNMSRIPG